MDGRNFDAVTRLAINVPDRRHLLKLVGAAALSGIVGFFARSDDAEAAVRVRITNLVTTDWEDSTVKNKKEADLFCAGVRAVDAFFPSLALDCGISPSPA